MISLRQYVEDKTRKPSLLLWVQIEVEKVIKRAVRGKRVPGQSGLAEETEQVWAVSRSRATIHSLSVCLEPVCGLNTFSTAVVIIPSAFLRSEKCSFRKIEGVGARR